jgi:hypothetical protein
MLDFHEEQRAGLALLIPDIRDHGCALESLVNADVTGHRDLSAGVHASPADGWWQESAGVRMTVLTNVRLSGLGGECKPVPQQR